MKKQEWKFWIDVGGTFTDCLAVDPGGTEHFCKVLSSAVTKGKIDSTAENRIFDDDRREAAGFWQTYRCRILDQNGKSFFESVVDRFDDRTIYLNHSIPEGLIQPGLCYELYGDELAPVLAIRRTIGLRLDESLPQIQLQLGTTKGTNALLTRSGARVALLTTAGFGDLLQIGDQDRPKLFELAIQKITPLCEKSVEIAERVFFDGGVLLPPDESAIRTQLEELKRLGIESIAICFIHGYQYPAHENLVADLAREIGFEEVSTSNEIAPLIKMVARAETTVLDAYLNPCLKGYLEQIQNSLTGQSSIEFMTSSGGLVDANRFTGKDSVLSGPAGGVVGMARVAEQVGFDKTIGFDMGGTSTDVARYNGVFERQYETMKAGIRIMHPVMAIETVAAGGGSICHFDGTRLRVGPSSAGAHPGPACYGNGGPLTITDVNLLLDRIAPSQFPFPLDRSAAQNAAATLCEQIGASSHLDYSITQLCLGFVQVANTHMAEAIRTISVAKGYDPREYTLVAFGGAAPQHACMVADELGIERILIHPRSSILSAVGISMATRSCHKVAATQMDIIDDSSENVEQIQSRFLKLENDAIEELHTGPGETDGITVAKSLDIRYKGTDFSLSVPFTSDQQIRSRFEAEYKRLFGYTRAELMLEIVAQRVEASIDASPMVSCSAPSRVELVSDSPNRIDRAKLNEGDKVVGPVQITDPFTTINVDENWIAIAYSGGQLVLERAFDTKPAAPKKTTPEQLVVDPTMLEVFNQHFVSIAEQMGQTLRKTSMSVNVKQRLDYSCALFSSLGELVVNAPHIPVHLGAMGESVRSTIERNPKIASGDVVVTNNPYQGGSHLPDVTVISPVFLDDECCFFVACRCHHAEIGGISPGSMPANATVLGEEGVLIDNFKVVDAGESQLELLRRLLIESPYPSRSVEENIADVNAQIAANKMGATMLKSLCQKYGLETTRQHMQYIRAAAETKVRRAVLKMPDTTRKFSDSMDDGSRIELTLTIADDRLQFDFTGSSSATSGNLNANRAIVIAAIMYCVRCLVKEDIPLNEGLLSPIELVLPECFLNPSPNREDPAKSPAVVGGNVETSQRIVDVILGAMELAAASQGTMNNLLFGDDHFGYYETICGGSGATADSPGADAVHSHMTNTRITDPEILENRYPVRLNEFSIRRGSGGDGQRTGGDGAVRSFQFLQPLKMSLLTSRRFQFQPFGMHGGDPGTAGKNLLCRADGTTIELPAQCEFEVNEGDRLTIETPGGGGWGNSRIPIQNKDVQ